MTPPFCSQTLPNVFSTRFCRFLQYFFRFSSVSLGPSSTRRRSWKPERKLCHARFHPRLGRRDCKRIRLQADSYATVAAIVVVVVVVVVVAVVVVVVVVVVIAVAVAVAVAKLKKGGSPLN